jgi:HAMP domain-containing protein
MAARAQQRAASRPGVVGRVAAAQQENAQAGAASQSRVDAMQRNADQIAQGRLDENERRRQGRQGEAEALETKVGELRQTAADRRAVSGQVGDLDQSLGSVTSMEELQKLAATFRELRDSGKLSAEQLGRLETSLDAASERVMEAGMAGSDSTRQAAEAGAAAAQAQTATSAAEVVGTFSGAALGQMGFGQNLAQKQLDVMTQIERNTREPMAGLVAD